MREDRQQLRPRIQLCRAKASKRRCQTSCRTDPPELALVNCQRRPVVEQQGEQHHAVRQVAAKVGHSVGVLGEGPVHVRRHPGQQAALGGAVGIAALQDGHKAAAAAVTSEHSRTRRCTAQSAAAQLAAGRPGARPSPPRGFTVSTALPQPQHRAAPGLPGSCRARQRVRSTRIHLQQQPVQPTCRAASAGSSSPALPGSALSALGVTRPSR